MSGRIKVLVVDDSVVVRKGVSDMLGSDPRIEVVGTAPNGRIALDKIGQICPDLVILDVEMPEMGGLETLRRIRTIAPRLPIVMFSSFTERGGALTLDALAQGASDYVTKPSSIAGSPFGLARVREELLGKVCALASSCLVPRAFDSRPTTDVTALAPALDVPLRASTAPASSRHSGPVDVVVIASSTGGPNAVSEIFARLAPNFPVPILIAQHMPPMFTRLFAERLAQLSGLDVREGIDGARLEAGQAWVAPGDFHMELRREGVVVRVTTNQGPPEHSCRPAADVLFRSAAACYGPGVLAVVLTGMGHDGLRGCEEVRLGGGSVLAQDQATSIVFSMPGAVAAAGLADRVLPIDAIGLELLRRVRGTPPSSEARR